MKTSKIDQLKAAERVAANAWKEQRQEYIGRVFCESAVAHNKALYQAWQDATAALRLAEEKAAKKADKKRIAGAELITGERDTRKTFDALRNASKESVFVAVQGESIVAKVATYATKSRTWGYTWRAAGHLPHTYNFAGTSASGCGYCKESQAIDNWLQYAIKGHKRCGGVGMDAAFDAFKDATLISLRLSGKSVKNVKFFRA